MFSFNIAPSIRLCRCENQFAFGLTFIQSLSSCQLKIHIDFCFDLKRITQQMNWRHCNIS